MSSILTSRPLRRFCGAMAFTCAMLPGNAAWAQSPGQPVRGGILTASLFPEPPSLNLGLQPTQTVQLPGSKVYESLLTFSPDLQPLPSLAKSWSVSSDQLAWTFQLQQGVKWHDGKPFTSADVVFSYQHILKNSSSLRPLLENTEEITAPDAHTVVFKLKQPYSPFLYTFDISIAAILPKHLYEGTDFASNPHNNAPVGTGPFKFAKWERGSYIELVRNPEYWREGLPYLDGITFRVIPDAASRRTAMEQGTIMQMLPTEFEPSDIAAFEKNKNIKKIVGGYEYWAPVNWIEMNNSVLPFNDKRFRQALMHALDRQFIIDKIRFGMGRLASGPFHHKLRYYTEDVKKYEVDIKKSIALLDDMGLKPDAKGVRATVSMLPLPFGEVYRRIAEYTKASFAKIGVVVNIEAVDFPTWLRRMGNGEFEMLGGALFQYGDPAIGVARSYVSSNIRKGVPFGNTSQYRNPKIDELFARAERAPDNERGALYAEIQKILVEDVPLLWLWSTEDFTFFNTRVQNVMSNALGPAGSYAEVWLTAQ